MKRWECTVCGYIHEGDEPPDECPVCSADKSMFVEIIEESLLNDQHIDSTGKQEAKPSFLATVNTIATDLILRHHLHPITVHTPNGIVPMAVVFFLITVALDYPTFETAALYSLIFVLLTMPAVLFTGFTVWQTRYRGAMTAVFKIKIGASIVTVATLVILIFWRVVNPDILNEPGSGRWLFLLFAIALLAAVGLAGHMGGKLVFGNRRT